MHRMGEIRQVTPALVSGVSAGVRDREERTLAEGVEGTVVRFGSGDSATTVVLTRVQASAAFLPALVLRDRSVSKGTPAELPAERWEAIGLESETFNRRYRLLALAGQDPGLVRELFSPSLIAWLEREPPIGFSVEVNEGFLTTSIPRHLEGEDLERFLGLTVEVVRRVEREIAEEEDVSLDVYDEEHELRDIERGLAEVGYATSPETVQEAIAAAKRRAGRKPATVLRALGWGVVAGAFTGAIAFVATGPAAAVAAALAIGLPALYIGWLVARAAYRWGRAGSVSRVGLEAWTRGYAQSRGLTIENRWRFHARHRELPMPGFADHVLEGRIPHGDGERGRLLFLGDAAELRATGQEIAFLSDRPLAATALLIDADRDVPPVNGGQLPDDYRAEVRGSQLLVWRPVPGNLIRTSAGTDRFCQRAAGIARELLGR
jgi:hypothetical protein